MNLKIGMRVKSKQFGKGKVISEYSRIYGNREQIYYRIEFQSPCEVSSYYPDGKFVGKEHIPDSPYHVTSLCEYYKEKV